jgi:hypothetical protein
MSSNPNEAERTQRRKLAFIPAWPVIASFAVVAFLVFYFAR